MQKRVIHKQAQAQYNGRIETRLSSITRVNNRQGPSLGITGVIQMLGLVDLGPILASSLPQ